MMKTTHNKLTAWLIALTMLFAILPCTAIAANAETPTDTWHDYAADSFEDGDGSLTDPYVIKTAEQLAKLSKDVMEGTAYKDTYFKLDDDINLSGHRWIPIGVHKWTAGGTTVNKPFSGSFDGNEKTVSNMYIDSALDDDYYSGFFGNISNYQATVSPVIKDLTIDNAIVNYNAEDQMDSISGIFAGRIGGNENPRVQISKVIVSNSTLTNTATNDYYAYQSGAFAGYLDYALIQNCHTKNVTITGGANNGGFVGLTSSFATYENCSASGSVSGSWGIGGFVSTAVDNASFTKCIADVDVTADNQNAGGFCGLALCGVEFNKCVAYGDVESTVTGFEPRLGGFAGSLMKTYMDPYLVEPSAMTECYFAGTLTSAHETIKPSWLVALVEDSTITDCAYDGELNADITGYTDETEATALSTKNLKAEICVNVSDGHDMEDSVCSICGYTEYDIYVGGIQVTSANAADVLGTADEGATVTYDAETNTLTLTDATIEQTTEYGIIVSDMDITIHGIDTEAEGSNNISGSVSAITSANTAESKNLKITGEFGNITGGSTGAIHNTEGDIIIAENAVIGDVSSGWYTIQTDNGNITIDGIVGNISGVIGITSETNHDTTINGKVGTITGTDYGIFSYKNLNITANAETGDISGTAGGLMAMEDVNISGKTGSINSNAHGIYAMGDVSVSGQIQEVAGQCPIRSVNGNIDISGTTGDISGNGGSENANSSYGIRADKGSITLAGSFGIISASSDGDSVTIMPIYAKTGINIADNLKIKTPENSKIDMYNSSYYTIFDTLGTADESDDIVASVIELVIPPTPSTGGGGLTRYTVKFNSNGGSNVSDVKVYRNDVLDEPTEPTRDGYTFAGWYKDAELTTAYDFTGKVTKNFTLYAKWVEDTTDKPIDKPETPPATPDAECDGTGDCPSLKFSDLDVTAWYHLDTDYVIENGIFNGITDTTFEPNSNLTRAMLVTVLYRIEGEPEVTGTITFEDVDGNAYYANAVLWAQQNGIIEGHSETEFAPDDNITREQFAAIMHRYAQFKGYDVSVGENTNILSYDDFDSISEYAISAIQYAVGSGLINGKTDTTINPQDNATRAECAAILHRFIAGNK